MPGQNFEEPSGLVGKFDFMTLKAMGQCFRACVIIYTGEYVESDSGNGSGTEDVDLSHPIASDLVTEDDLATKNCEPANTIAHDSAQAAADRQDPSRDDSTSEDSNSEAFVLGNVIGQGDEEGINVRLNLYRHPNDESFAEIMILCHEKDEHGIMRTTEAAVRFNNQNLESPLHLTPLHPDAALDQRGKKIRDSLLRRFGLENNPDVPDLLAEGKLHHVLIGFNNEFHYGMNMYCDSPFGKHHEVMQLVRSYFSKRQDIEILVHSQLVARSIERLNAQMEEIEAKDPLRAYCDDHNTETKFQFGQHKSRADHPDTGPIPARMVWDSFERFAILIGHGLAYEKETIEQAKSQIHKSDAILLRLPTASGEGPTAAALTMLINSTGGAYHLKAGDSIKVNFVDSDLTSEDWHGVVLVPCEFAWPGQVHVFATRPYDEKNMAYKSPSIVADVDPEQFEDHAQARQLIQAAPKHHCYIRVLDSAKDAEKGMESIQYAQEEATDVQRNIMMARDLRNLPEVDFYAPLPPESRDSIIEWSHNAMGLTFTDSQNKAHGMLSNLTGGVLLLDGPAGTGKSAFITSAIQPLLAFTKTKVLFIASINKAADAALLNIEAAQCKVRSATDSPAKMRGSNNFVIVRYHSQGAEEDICKLLATMSRPAKPNEKPPIFNDRKIEKSLLYIRKAPPVVFDIQRVLAILHTKSVRFQLHQPYHIRDERVTEITWSVGYRMLRKAGLLDNLHPDDSYAEPSKYLDFRRVYERLAKGEEMDENDNALLKRGLNLLYADVVGNADVLVLTPTHAGTAKVYEYFRPTGIIFDEAACAGDWHLAHLFRFPNVQWWLLAGDDKQAQIILQSQKNDNPHYAQLRKSFLTRFRVAGVQSVFFDESTRQASDVCEIVSEVFYGKRLKALPGIDDSSVIRIARGFMEKTFGPRFANSSICLIDVKGDCRKLYNGHTKFNETSAAVALRMVELLGEAGYEYRDIGLSSPYQGQVDLFRRGISKVAKDKLDAKVQEADIMTELEIRTFDGFQGQEKHFMVNDTTVSDIGGFVTESSRINVGISRARGGQIVIADVSKIVRSRDFNGSALKKVIEILAKKKLIYKWNSAADLELLERYRRLVSTRIPNEMKVVQAHARKCKRCGHFGHVAEACEVPLSCERKCEICGETGHQKLDCPNAI